MRPLLLVLLLTACSQQPWVGTATQQEGQDPIRSISCTEEKCICIEEQYQRVCEPAFTEEEAMRCCDE